MTLPSHNVRIIDVRFRLTCMYNYLKCQFNRILLPKMIFFLLSIKRGLSYNILWYFCANFSSCGLIHKSLWDSRFEAVKEFKYFGSALTSNSNEWISTKENCDSQRSLFLDIKYRGVESRSYKTIIGSILRYAWETWRMYEKVEVAHRVTECMAQYMNFTVGNPL